jgi:hypothetical protein
MNRVAPTIKADVNADMVAAKACTMQPEIIVACCHTLDRKFDRINDAAGCACLGIDGWYQHESQQ